MERLWQDRDEEPVLFSGTPNWLGAGRTPPAGLWTLTRTSAPRDGGPVQRVCYQRRRPWPTSVGGESSGQLIAPGYIELLVNAPGVSFDGLDGYKQGRCDIATEQVSAASLWLP
jgi:hypothetical protein